MDLGSFGIPGGAHQADVHEVDADPKLERIRLTELISPVPALDPSDSNLFFISKLRSNVEFLILRC